MQIISYQPAQLIPIEQELAEKIPTEILPALRSIYTALLGVQEDWDVGHMTEKVEAAAKTGAPLCGFSPSDWIAWAATLRFIMGALRQPMDELGGVTAREIFLSRPTPVS